MMKKVMSVLLCVLVMLSVCACGTGKTEYIDIYRPVKTAYQNSGELLRAEQTSAADDRLESALKALMTSPDSPELDRSVPENVTLGGYELRDGELVLELSEEYLELSGMAKTIVDYCLTLTLCKEDNVKTVSIYINGEPVQVGMTADDAVLVDTDGSPNEKQIRLYFVSENGENLECEYRSVSVDEEIDTAWVVMEELLRGPAQTQLSAAVPVGTHITDISISDDLCIVELSEEFIDGLPETALGQRLAIYSVVNSLTSLIDIDQVRISVGEGNESVYGCLPLDITYTRNEEILRTANSAKGEIEVNVYMLLSDGKRFMAVRRIVSRQDDSAVSESALEALMTGGTEQGCLPLFYEEDTFNSISVAGNVCTVDLPREFFSRRDNENDIFMAAMAITASMTDIEGIDKVKFTMDGSAAVYGNLSLTRIYQKSSVEIEG